jgi:hypothetical protein
MSSTSLDMVYAVSRFMCLISTIVVLLHKANEAECS